MMAGNLYYYQMGGPGPARDPGENSLFLTNTIQLPVVSNSVSVHNNNLTLSAALGILYFL